jgi:hypothetical protein
MKREVGIWIDHRKTVTMNISDEGHTTSLMESGMEKHVRFSGAAQDDSAEDQLDSRFTAHLNKYYDRVISSIRDADAILVLGPGEAKVEFEKRLTGEALGGRVVGIETADKMTDRQIAARVRRQFPKRKQQVSKSQPHVHR